MVPAITAVLFFALAKTDPVDQERKQTCYTVSGIDAPIIFDFGVSVAMFVILTVIVGFVKSLGKAATHKHIPVCYPVLTLATMAARAGMDDIADARVSLSDQLRILERTHNWIMCVL